MEPQAIKLFDLKLRPEIQGPVFSLASPDLNWDLLRFDEGEGLPLPVNVSLGVAEIVLEAGGAPSGWRATSPGGRPPFLCAQGIGAKTTQLQEVLLLTSAFIFGTPASLPPNSGDAPNS